MSDSQTATAVVLREDRTGAAGWLPDAVFWCFLLSGATSLILQGTLTRLLRFVLGNTTLAITTVLCAFMAGLALGSYVGGRLSDRSCRPLRTYGLLEGAVGVCCLLLPAVIAALEPAYRLMYLHLQDSPVALSLARFLLCGLLLLIPSTFMGATLPILARWYSQRQGQMGRSIASLYAINSLGAAAGALVCGFLLLPGVGVTWTLRLACLTAIAICGVMLLLDRSVGGVALAAENPAEPTRTEDAEVTGRGWRIGLLIAYGLSGAAALVYEVAWTRGLALVIGSSVYAFSLMLTAFILGLAIGSAILARRVDRLRNRVYWFAVVEIGIGLSAMAALPLIGHLPVTMVDIVQWLRASFAAMQAVEFLLILLVMIVPTILMGAAFPLVCRASAWEGSGIGRSIGSVYAANTVGAIVGSAIASFVLIPTWGTHAAILVAVAANLLIGVVVLLAAPRITWLRRAGTGLVAVLLGAWAFQYVQPWDPSIMSSGAYIYADRLAMGGNDASAVRQRMRRATVLYHKEDMCTAVTVREYADGVRTLAVGGKVDASNRGDMSTQLLLSHGPLLLHPNPRSALVIGLASGITLGAAATYDLERIDCAEISSAVVEASRYFDPENRHVLQDPRVQLIVGDGRNHLALTSVKYDMITSEPSNPWIAGVADLFTREFFELCKQRLNPGGLACVWLHAYQMEEPLFRSVVHTFHETFGHTLILESAPPMDYLLIGSAEPIRVPYVTLTSRFFEPKIAADMQRINMREPLDFLRRVLMVGNVAEYAKGAILHTDDNALLEFAAPRGMYRSQAEVWIAESVNAHRQVDLSFLEADPAQRDRIARLETALEPLAKAQSLGAKAIGLYSRGQYEEAFAAAGEAARLDPSGPEILNAKGKSIIGWAMDIPDPAAAETVRKRVVSLAPNLLTLFQKQAAAFEEMGQWADAVDVLCFAAFLQPKNLGVIDRLAWLQATSPQASARNGREAVERSHYCCQESNRQHPGYLKTLAAAHAENGNFEGAVRQAEEALKLAYRSGQPSLAAEIETQLSFYRQGKAYRLAGK
jgi:spermidine synthase